MRAATWLRTAAVLMLLFATGHTLGFLTFQAPSAEGRAVFDAMNSVRFSKGQATYSYGDFYRGFGLTITVSQLFFAWMSWVLAVMAKQGSWMGVKQIAWGMAATQVAGVALSLKYFSLGPALFSAMAMVCFAMAAIKSEEKISVGSVSSSA